MPPILLASNAYRRASAHLPEARLVNRYLEQDPTNRVSGVAILPRPALKLWADLGAGAVRAVWRQSGSLGGDWLVVVGQQLWRVTTAGVATAIGTVSGTDLVEIDGDGTNVFIASETLYLYNGSALSTVTMPSNKAVTSVRQFNGYFLLQVKDSGQFYWIEPGAIIVDPLNFATAERAPDVGVAIRILGDFIVFLQASGAEYWVSTGNATAPFQRQSGIVIDKGCSFRETAVNMDNGIFWVGETADEGRVVYRSAAGSPQRISVFGIEERMRGAYAISALAFTFDGHAFYALRIEGVGTFAYDAATGYWSEFASYGFNCWRPQCSGSAPGAPLLLGDFQDGKLWTLDEDAGDDEGEPIVRVVSGLIPTLQRAGVDSISLQASVGWSPTHDLEPMITMRLARDGFTFGDPKVRSLGNRGQYGKRVRWERQGEMRPPGLVVEFTDSDACQTRLSYARFNEIG